MRAITAAERAKAEHFLIIALARAFPGWISQLRLARTTLVQQGLIPATMRRLLDEGKVEQGSCLFQGPNPSVIYRLIDTKGGK
jgi:hypothetical protein